MSFGVCTCPRLTEFHTPGAAGCVYAAKDSTMSDEGATSSERFRVEYVPGRSINGALIEWVIYDAEHDDQFRFAYGSERDANLMAASMNAAPPLSCCHKHITATRLAALESERLSIRQLIGASDRCVWRDATTGAACNTLSSHQIHLTYEQCDDAAVEACVFPQAHHPFSPESTLDAVRRVLSDSGGMRLGIVDITLGEWRCMLNDDALDCGHMYCREHALIRVIHGLRAQLLTDEGRDKAAEEIAEEFAARGYIAENVPGYNWRIGKELTVAIIDKYRG